MATEWYLMGSMPVYNSGYEKEEFDMFAKDSFTELLETSPVSGTIQIIKHDSTLVTEIKSVVLNNVADSIAKSKERHILSTVGTLQCGDYIRYENIIWLVTSFVGNNGIYEKSIAELCNFSIKFQSPNGTILSYPCIDETTQRIGEKETDVITLGDGVHNIKLPFDENTVLLAPDRRFFLSKHPTRPTPYKIIGDPNTSTYNYGGKGLIELRVKQDLFDEKVDNVELGICDYKEPTSTPPPVEGYSYSEIICSNPNNEITLGGSARTLTQKCFEADGTVVNGIIPVWSFNWNGFNASNFVVTYPTTDTCAIKVKENYDLVGENIVISVMGSDGGYGGEITLMITS